MAIRKRGNLWQIDVSICGIRHRVTAKTKKAAQEEEKKLMETKNPQRAAKEKSGTSSPRLRPSRIPKRHGLAVVK
jgi:hypothetical protein